MSALPADLFSPPKQQRSRESLERVLEAAAAVLEEGGYEAFGVQEVCQRAGVGVGVVYTRLGSKEGLLRAVHARALERRAADRDELLGAVDPRVGSAAAVIAAAVAAQAELFRRHQKLFRVFMVQAETDRWILERGAGSSDANARVFAELLLARRAEIRHPDPELAVDVAYRLVYDTLARRIMRGATFESSRVIEWDALVQELGRVCASYLLQPPAE
jgi:AcrR family transcriptional regulator